MNRRRKRYQLSRRGVLRLSLVSCLCLVLGGCVSPPPADNLLFISFDTTRADHLSAYGYEHRTSPTVEKLAESGVLFQRAFTAVPSTLAAHTTMFTGLLPPTHGVRCNGRFRVSDAHTTLAETLSANGFSTAAVLAALPLDPRFGLGQGFGTYDARFGKTRSGIKPSPGRMDKPGTWLHLDYDDFERGADEVVDLALEWLEDPQNTENKRWFLFTHFFDAHWPYEPTAAWAERFDLPYDAEIAFEDEQLDRLLTKVRAMPGRTLIIFTSDHGEGLGDHKELLHNRFLYNSTLHVPLIISLEETTLAGHRVAENVGHMDLMPTILDLLRIDDHPEVLSGRNLLPALQGKPLEAAPLYAETLVHKLENDRGIAVRALIEGDLKYIHTEITHENFHTLPVRELYNMAEDPAELNNLTGPNEVATTRKRLRQALAAKRRELEGTAFEMETIDLDDKTTSQLKALGYL